MSNESKQKHSSLITRHSLLSLDLRELPFDHYQRYRDAQEIIRILRKGSEKLTILDVGGYFRFSGEDLLPAPLFLPEDNVTVLDTVDCSLPGYVQGTGSQLTFSDRAFDVVMTCDTLEHVQPNEREVFIKELLRVARNYIILGAPFYSESTQLAEKLLYEFIIRETGRVNAPLAEHIQNGLPHLEDVYKILHQKQLDYLTLPSGYLYNWLFIMVLRHFIFSLPDPAQMDAIINKFYNLNLYEQDHREPSYRSLLVISKRPKELAPLKAIKDHFASMLKPAVSPKGSSLELIQLLLELIRVRKENQQREVPDVLQDKAETSLGNLLHPRVIGQSFLATRSHLCRVDVMFGTYNRLNTCELTFRLKTDPQDKEELVVVKANARFIQDGLWYTFRFPPLADSQGKSYYFSLESSTTDPGNALTVWYTPTPYIPFGLRYENGKPATGCLRFRTYSFIPEGFEKEFARLREEYTLQILALRRDYESKLQNILAELGGLRVGEQ